MRKLFIVLLLVSLVPFTVGCNGLFSNDSDGSDSYFPAPTKASMVKLSVRLGHGQNPSLRATVGNATSTSVMIAGFEAAYNSTTGNYEVTVPQSAITTTKVTAVISYYDGTTRKTATVEVPVTTIAPNGDTSSAAVNTYVVTIGTDGSVSVAVTNNTSSTTVTTPANTVTTALQVASVKYGDVGLTSSAMTAVEVTSLTPSFVVDMGTTSVNSYSDWKVRVSKMVLTQGEYAGYNQEEGYTETYGVSSSYEIKSSDESQQFTITPDGTTVKVDLTTVTKTLSAGNIYKVELVYGKVNGTAVEPFVVYFQTAAAAATDAVVQNVTVNGTEVYASTSTTVPVKNGTASDTVIALTFDKAVTVPTDGTVTITRGTTHFDVSLPTGATLSNSNKTVTVTFADNPLVASQTYKVDYKSGTWTGVKTAPTSISFTTAE